MIKRILSNISHALYTTNMHAILLQKSSENKTLVHGKQSSVFVSDQPLQTMFASSLLGVLAGSSAGKHFQRGAGSEKAVCRFCFPKLHALIPSDKLALDPPQHVTLALLEGKEHRPFISEEGKSETYRKGWTWSTPRRSHLPQLYLSWETHRNLKIQQYISEALYLGFNSSKNRPAFLRQNSLVLC